MSNLKELTWEYHKRAERTQFVHRMLKKEMTVYQYYVYLFNQFLMYSYLEEKARNCNAIDESLFHIMRASNLSKDLLELVSENNFKTPRPLESTIHYMNYIDTIKDDPDRLLAHMYVRHMGDLSGGQIIKRFVPGSGLHYHFEEDTEVLKEKFRKKLHDGLAEEAKVCFDMVREFMEELENSFGNLRDSN